MDWDLIAKFAFIRQIVARAENPGWKFNFQLRIQIVDIIEYFMLIMLTINTLILGQK